jgi:hypothetical protein
LKKKMTPRTHMAATGERIKRVYAYLYTILWVRMLGRRRKWYGSSR